MNRKITLITIGIVTIVFIVVLAMYKTDFFATGSACTTGHWCPIASSTNDVFLCPGGTFGSTAQLTTPACSGPCSGGCVCEPGSKKPCEKPCPAGSYCVKGTGGDTKPIPCPKGYYCPEGSENPIACPAGIFCDVGTTGIPVASNSIPPTTGKVTVTS